MNYYEHHLGDYVRDAGHLSMLEDGAYRRLLDAYYIREGALPRELRDVCRLIRAQARGERAAVATILREFFHLTDDGWHHTRCDKEIMRYVEKRAKARESANMRWSAGMRTHCDGNALQTPVTNHQSPDSLGREKEKKDLRAEGQDGSRLAADWALSEVDCAFARGLGLSEAEARFEAAKFKDFWRARAGRDGMKRDWAATWRNWVRNCLERRGVTPALVARASGSAHVTPHLLVTRGEPEHDAWLAHYVRIGRHRDPQASFLDRLSVPARWPPQAEDAAQMFHGKQDIHRPAGEQGA